MKTLLIALISSISLALLTGIGGFVLGSSSSEIAPVTPTVAPEVLHSNLLSQESKALLIQLSAPITLTANLETGYFECSNEFGRVTKIMSYWSESGTMAERTVNGNIVVLNPAEELKFCTGYAG